MPDEQAGTGGDGEDRDVLTRPARTPSFEWRYGLHADQVADVFEPSGAPRAAVVLVHGGFWRPEYDRLHLRPMADALAQQGLVVVSLEYRRIPGDPDATVGDVGLALRALAAGDVPANLPTARHVIGHSAGGHLALLMADDSGNALASCLALAPVADLREADRLRLDGDAVRAFLGTDPAARPDLDPGQLPPPTIPVTVLQGARDEIVPASVSTVAAWQDRESGTPRFVDVAGAGHFSLIDPTSSAWPQVLMALAALTG